MDRRGFLRGLVGVAPAIIRPTYFFSPVGGWIRSADYSTATHPIRWRHLTPQDIEVGMIALMANFQRDISISTGVPIGYLFGVDYHANKG